VTERVDRSDQATVSAVDDVTRSVAGVGDSLADAVTARLDELKATDAVQQQLHEVLDALREQQARQDGQADAFGVQLTALQSALVERDDDRWRGELDRALDQMGQEVLAAVADVRAQVDRGAGDASGLRLSLDAALERVVAKLQGDVNRVLTSVSSSDELLDDRLRRVDSQLGEVRDTVEGMARGGGSNLPVLATQQTESTQITGFEAGAVLGASQAAWTRLEQRLDHDFDDLTAEVQQLRHSLELAVRALEQLAARQADSAPLKATATAVRKAAKKPPRKRT
jgi:hypothetical protein